jgi:Tol biopolymer transport system component
VKVKQITTRSEVQIVPPAQAGYWGASFTPDGQHVYYALVENQQNPSPSLFQISTLGGTPKKVLTGLASPFSLSPDGQRIAFTRRDRAAGTMSLNVSRADGSEERTLATRKEPDLFYDPVWSPDGASVTCVNSDLSGGQPRLVSIDVNDGMERPIATPKFYRIVSLAWLTDSSGLILIAKETAAKTQQIWYVSYPGGEARRITNDLLDYISLSLSADSDSLVTNQGDMPAKLWLYRDLDLFGAAREGFAVDVARGSPIPPVQLAPGRQEGRYGLSWTPDGKIVYASNEGGHHNIWIVDVGGGNRRQLTSGDHWDSSPSVSPDGRHVAFVSDRAGAQHVWRMDSDGGNQIQLTSGSVDTAPQFSPDGNWVIYNSAQGGTVTVWKVPIEGGQPTQVTRTHSLCPVISPDGRFMAYTYKDEGAGQMKIGVIPSEGGDILKSFDIARNVQPDSLRWAPDGRALVYKRLTEGNSNLWRQDLAGGEPHKMSNFTSDGPYYCDWSRDAKQLACARGSVLRDAILITNFR